jgi:hypothetical protein
VVVRHAQGLDLGLTVASVMLLLLVAIVHAQAGLLSVPGTKTVEARVSFSDGKTFLAVDGAFFDLANAGTELAHICAAEKPPVLALTFPHGTAIEAVHGVRDALRSNGSVICGVAY